MLFPDKFLLYDKFSGELLEEHSLFERDNVLVIGNPDIENVGFSKLDAGGKIPILVVSNPISSCELISFIDHYIESSSYGKKYFWFIKIHPRENYKLWDEFTTRIKSSTIVEDDIFTLLNSLEIQLNSFSTSIVDGMHFGVKSYTLPSIVDTSTHDKKFAVNTNYIDKLWTDEFVPDENRTPTKVYENFSLHFMNKLAGSRKNKLLVETIDDDDWQEWQNLVNNSPHGNVFQSFEWLSCYDQSFFKRIVIKSDGKFIAGMVIPLKGSSLLLQKLSGPLIIYPPQELSDGKMIEFQKRILSIFCS